jgi:RNA-directed DNA polymerase
MDDVVLLAPTRHKLRRAVRVLNQTFDALGLEKHPDKTFIGRAKRGFDFLGYHLAPGRLTLAQATVERFLERAYRLHEQEREKPEGFPRLGAYTKRWMQWSRAGLTGRLPAEAKVIVDSAPYHFIRVSHPE